MHEVVSCWVLPTFVSLQEWASGRDLNLRPPQLTCSSFSSGWISSFCDSTSSSGSWRNIECFGETLATSPPTVQRRLRRRYAGRRRGCWSWHLLKFHRALRSCFSLKGNVEFETSFAATVGSWSLISAKLRCLWSQVVSWHKLQHDN